MVPVRNPKFFVLLSVVFLALHACDYDHPESLYDPDEPSGPTPVIQSVLPADSALAGVSEITITGENLSGDPEKISVFFGGKKAEILSATATEVMVRSPNFVQDSIPIKITIHGAELFSDAVYYKLIPAVEEIAKKKLKTGETAKGITFDSDNYMYVSTDEKKIRRFDPQGNMVDFANTTFLFPFGFQTGPGGRIFAGVSAGRLKRVSVFSQAGVESQYTSLTGNPKDLDIDQDGTRIWIGVDDEIQLIRADSTTTNVTTMPLPVQSLRVYYDQLLVNGYDTDTGEQQIWKMNIQGENLGSPVSLLDAGSASWLEGAVINSFCVDVDGLLYLATDHSPDALFIYDPSSGEHEVLYAGLIEPPLYTMTWTNGIHIIAIRHITEETEEEILTNTQFLRIYIGKTSAPYYGRN